MRIILAVLVFIVLITALQSFFMVDQREQVLVLQLGDPVKVVKDPGLNFKIPFIQNIVRVDNRVLDLSARPNEVIASDQKRLIVNAFVKFKVTDPLRFYQTVRTEDTLIERLNTNLDSSMRQILGSFPLSSLLTDKRPEIMRDIQQSVRTKSLELGVEVIDVRIMRADLPQKNSEAIYRRMQTEREREAKEFRAQGAEEAQRIKSRADKERTVILAEADKQSQILKGEGEAEATRIFADAFSRDEEFFSFYRTMQAYRETLKKDDTTMILSPDNDFMKYFGDIRGKKNP